jgi:hypothetical protein
LIVCPVVFIIVETFVEGCETTFADVFEDMGWVVIWLAGVDAVGGKTSSVKGADVLGSRC